MSIAKTPPPPYYAVIFSSLRTDQDDENYQEMTKKMEVLAQQQEGYLGHEGVREGLGITVSYWDSLEAIKKWKANSKHLEAQEFGRKRWYAAYKTRICLVQRDYGF